MSKDTTSITENENDNHSRQKQLELFPVPVATLPIHQKPQVVSIPGVPATTRRRYQVTIGDRVIASHIDSDTAWEIAANYAGIGEADA